MSSPVLYYGDPINRSNPLMRGILARYQVVPWYANGPRWIDLAGNRYHGTRTNGPTWQAAKIRQGGRGSIFFDGTDDYVVLPQAAMQAEGATTIAAWVRPDTVSGNDGIWYRGSNVGSGSAGNRSYFYVENGMIVRGSKLGTGTFSVNTTGAAVIAALSWSHVVATVDPNASATNRIKIYINGIDRSSTETWNGAFVSTDGLDNDIGRLGSGGTYGYFDGRMDGILMWSRALAAGEVRQLYDATSRRIDPTLSWIWPVEYFGVTAAGPVEKTDTDSATLAESALVGPLETDAGALAEASQVGPADTDAGTLAEAAQVGPSDSDGGTVAETSLPGLLDIDSATLGESLALVLPSADVFTLAEAGLVGPTELDAFALDEAVVVAADLAGVDAGTLDDSATSLDTGGGKMPWLLLTGRVY